MLKPSDSELGLCEAPIKPVARSYELEAGETLELTLEEFNDIVKLFKMLLAQDLKNKSNPNPIEKGLFEPESFIPTITKSDT